MAASSKLLVEKRQANKEGTQEAGDVAAEAIGTSLWEHVKPNNKEVGKDGEDDPEEDTLEKIGDVIDKVVNEFSDVPIIRPIIEGVEGLLSEVAEITKQIPLFGELVVVLDAIIKASVQVNVNKKSCQVAAIWARSMHDAINHASKVLLEVHDLKASVGPLMEELLRFTKDLLQMMASYMNRHYILKLITSRVFKNKFEDAKSRGTDLLACMQLVMQSVTVTVLLSKEQVQQTKAAYQVQQVQSTTIVVHVDAQLDQHIEEQNRVLEQLLKGQNRTQKAIDLLIEEVLKGDPDAGPQLRIKLEGSTNVFTREERKPVKGDFVDTVRYVACYGLGSFPAWIEVARKLAGEDDIMNETEWEWLMKKRLSKAMSYSYTIPEHNTTTNSSQLSPNHNVKHGILLGLKKNMESIAEVLQFSKRGLFFDDAMKVDWDGGRPIATVTLIWPVEGPKMKSSDLEIEYPTNWQDFKQDCCCVIL